MSAIDESVADAPGKRAPLVLGHGAFTNVTESVSRGAPRSCQRKRRTASFSFHAFRWRRSVRHFRSK